MKQKLYSLVILTSLFAITGFASINAAETTETTTQTEVTTTGSSEEITTSSDTVITEETTTVEESTTVVETTTVAITPAANSVAPVTTKNINKTIKVGKKYSIKKKLKISDANLTGYSFASSNNDIVTVANGIATGIKYGKATVTVKNKNNQIVAKINIKVKNNYTNQELRYLSSIIYCEARGECYAGKLAVGIVVLNRMKSDLYPDDMVSVIYQRGQFTPTRNGAMSKALAKYDNGKLSKKCIKAAKEVLNGRRTVNYKSSEYDLSKFLFFSRYVPRAKLRIQHHMFK
ncbi:MAG: cell wall hydrolase [Lachnospiraceae bacterium]|nr:cell wall hydrolase [Lachnospiraceae bacterium]